MPTEPTIISVYAAYSTIDDHGRLGTCHGYFKVKEEAEALSRGTFLSKTHKGKGGGFGNGIGWYGGEGTVIRFDAIEINDKLYILKNVIKTEDIGADLIEIEKQRKKDALAKLTDQEKELLGLKD